MQIKGCVAALAVVLLALTAGAADDASAGVNGEGFITRWLLLAPIPLAENQNGAEGLDKEQVASEAKLQPKEGDKVKAGGKELTWKKYQAEQHFFDFNAFLGQQTENSVGYAVCYLVADKDLKNLKMKTGSDDQAKVFLNGKEVLKQAEARALDKDQDTTEKITLNKGVNTLVFKVVNEGVDWSGCVRFVDQDDKPVTGLKVKLTPQ